MRQIHLKANSRRSKHFFFHYLYQHNFIITRQFFSRMENIKNNFNFPSNDYSSSPEWTLKYSALQKKLSDNCFLSRNLCSHHIKSLCCYAPPPPPVLNHYIMILIQPHSLILKKHLKSNSKTSQLYQIYFTPLWDATKICSFSLTQQK